MVGESDWVVAYHGDEFKFQQWIPLNSNSTVMIEFSHSRSGPLMGESWWFAGLALDLDQESGAWRPVDINQYRKFSFEARGSATRPFEINEYSKFISDVRASTKIPAFKMSRVPLKIRFEDASVEAANGKIRQSSSWYPKNISLKDEFQTFELELERFDWHQDAWPSNIAPVDKQHILQVVFGQDDSIPSSNGQIEIRRLRLLPEVA
jgi:hypothetical protein